jgi:hypothetical protein
MSNNNEEEAGEIAEEVKVQLFSPPITKRKMPEINNDRKRTKSK